MRTHKASTRWTRTAAAIAASAMGVGVALVGIAPAQAAVIGTLAVSPTTGNNFSVVTVTTSAACPAPATNIIVKMTGSGFLSAQNVVSNSPVTAYSTTGAGGYIVPLSDTLDGFAKLQSPAATLTGRYDFTATCRLNAGVTTYGDFTGSLWYTAANTWQNTDPALDPVTTGTVVGTAPSGSANLGTSVAVQATVTPSAAAGNVEFFDGATSLGSSAVSGGLASINKSDFTVGSHALTGVFTPTDVTAYKPSTSAVTNLTILGAPKVTSVAKVVGTVRVGYRVSCSVGFSGATSVKYQWLYNGVGISGGTASTYVIPSTLYLKYLSCRATATNTVGSTPSTSGGIRVAAGIFKKVKSPYVYGSVRVGKVVYVKVGTWSPTPTAYAYQWLRNGKAIRGAVKSSYKVAAGDKGAYISFNVTVKKTGYTNAIAASNRIKAV